ncbi:MAG: DNA/RNA non-specific endonuclease [Candidatus Cryptobacteroides sp.]|nr:DNA/RNA non-specific endonuclease [Bacteroidales bacterium]MDY6158002.1 DNA/RNA non-specific endonuclease [Candidatus Cryptobacteroides sp.]
MLLNKIIGTKSLSIISSLLILCSCGGASTGAKGAEGELLLSVPKMELEAKASQQFIKVTAYASWTLDFDFAGEQAWARVDKPSGNVSASDIVLSWDAYEGEGESRSFTLTLKSAGKEVSSVVTQKADARPAPGPGPITDIKSDPVAKWMELPAMGEEENLYFITHDMSLSDGSNCRNFSIYYDIDAKISSWAAYPLNSKLMGTGSRSDEWGYDPKVPAKYQATLFSGYKPDDNSTRYDRGHQLPSADRPLWEPNVATFYFTNMTPQINALNGGAWANLEGKVRTWANKFDTLYVVTGADYKSSDTVAYDNNYEPVTVPVGYYKALLGYKKSGTIGNSTGGWLGIAFYFEHRSYSNSDVMSKQSMTIDELEDRLDIDFFVNLPDRVGQEMAGKIESTKDSWWK